MPSRKKSPGYYVEHGGYGPKIGLLAHRRFLAGPFERISPALMYCDRSNLPGWVAAVRINNDNEVIRIVITHINFAGERKSKVLNTNELRRARHLEQET